MFVNVKFNGVLKSAGTAKIQEFDTFSKCKSRGGGYHFSHGEPLKCPVERVCTGFTHVKLKKDSVNRDNQWGKRIRKFKVFGLLRGC